MSKKKDYLPGVWQVGFKCRTDHTSFVLIRVAHMNNWFTYVRFEVVIAGPMKITTYWDVMPCSLVVHYCF
jgi:hypothetical protein